MEEMHTLKNKLPEIWGGIECTINRVHDKYLDQLEMAGLYNNPGYLVPILNSGIKKIRFPILWEKHQRVLSSPIDWSFTEACLQEFRFHKIEPIAGLLHHGSGPAFTDLTQDDFPELFAAYAGAVAGRFPDINYYTPVNEPLTTARFSGLYGLWFPHKKNDVVFIKMLLNELKATVLAMQEIRKINPAAQLIQTEDLGKTYSTPLLSYQADFENHRRWLSFDILCGNLDATHPLWHYFMRLGIDRKRLQFFTDNPCVPDIIGVNHYLTSERYLDENSERYPISSVGGNGLHRYADVEAVRVQMEEPHGLPYLLKEIWTRYRIPIAITEAHLNCTREEQVRWFSYVYDVAKRLTKEGVIIKAVTAWALLGSFGWNKLLTCNTCDYETGAIDISAGYARPTALFSLIMNPGSAAAFVWPLLSQPGWWALPGRFYKTNKKYGGHRNKLSSLQPVIIIGETGTLGKAFAKICDERNIHHYLVGRTEADLIYEDQLEALMNRYKPWAVINAAGYVKVEEAETDKDSCYRDNFHGIKNLVTVCKRHAVKLLTFSSDLVFGGVKCTPYIETDVTDPVNVYGHSKQQAENYILAASPYALIIRTAAFFGPWDEHNFVYKLLASIKTGRPFAAAVDITVSPTYIPHLVHASLDLLIDDASGIWHLANKGAVSWYELANKIVGYTNLKKSLIIPVYSVKAGARHPQYSVLGSCKYAQMPSLDEGVASYFLSQPLLKDIHELSL